MFYLIHKICIYDASVTLEINDIILIIVIGIIVIISYFGPLHHCSVEFVTEIRMENAGAETKRHGSLHKRVYIWNENTYK